MTGRVCDACGWLMIDGHGCRHGRLAAHRLCCPLCPLLAGPDPQVGSDAWWSRVRARLQVRSLT